MVEADGEQLFRVFHNICRNAVEALDAASGTLGRDAAIFLGATVEARTVVVRIFDNGPGLPKRARDKLFVAFQGGARAGGTGLGLAIAADLVRAHLGTLRVLDESAGDKAPRTAGEPWPGARFEITLPAARPQ